MEAVNAPVDFYSDRIGLFEKQILELDKRRRGISVARVATVLLTSLLLYFFWQEGMLIRLMVFLAGAVYFFNRVFKDVFLQLEKENLEKLIRINHQEIDTINHACSAYDDGLDLRDAHHAYAEDLDIFGPASIYQYLNRGRAQQSRQWLAHTLLNPLHPKEIIAVQEAVKETMGKIPWAQQFLAYGMSHPLTLLTEKKITNWMKSCDKTFTAPFWKWILIVYPVIPIGVLILYISGLLSFPFFLAVLLGCWIFSFYLSSKIQETYTRFTGIAPEIASLYDQLHQLESENFSADYILNIKKSIQSKEKATVSKEIFRLKNILKRFDFRLNIYVFIFLNIFLLWDLRQLRALYQWRRDNERVISIWFEAVARLETLIGLSSFAFNEPGRCFPVLTDPFFTLNGVGIGHPLIVKEKRINNSFTLSGTGKIALITGSNMAGKSTFLRSIGLNIVLAQMGSAVCAESFHLSPVRLMSSMRIADNLAENTSTFYAELKKLQSIIEAINRNEQVFILLDEMLRGTNSLDRHIGSQAMIRQLIRRHAVAVIATHDIDLAKPEETIREALTNYYFDVQVSNDELYFDYKLKPGICQSLNASLLMKKIGIDLDT